MSIRRGPLKPSFINTYSLDFDGMDDYVNLGTDASLDIFGGDFTISLWAKWGSQTTNSNGIVSFGANANKALIGLGFGTEYGKISFTTRIIPNGTLYDMGSGYDDNLWHNIICTLSGTTRTCYVDGVDITATALSANLSVGTNNDIGVRDRGGQNRFFVGSIDEVCILDRVVTPTEITTLSTAPTVDLTSLNSIAWWRNGDNGTYKSPQWLIPSNENKDKVSNYSTYFDGTDQYLNIGSPSALSNTSNFSISCWVKKGTTSTAYTRIFGKYASASDMIFLGTAQTTNYFKFYIENGGSSSFVESNVGIGFNVWKHVTLVFDGTLTGNQNRAKIYVDGVNVTATDGGTIPATTTADTSDFLLGKVNGLGIFYYLGNMDEFAIFDYSLTPAEVLSISSEPTDLTSLSPTSWLKLGDNSTFAGGVWTVVDEVGSNDGTSVNMDIDDRVGTAPSSSNNAVSFNMDLIDRISDTP
jgi:hypothetical protein